MKKQDMELGGIKEIGCNRRMEEEGKMMETRKQRRGVIRSLGGKKGRKLGSQRRMLRSKEGRKLGIKGRKKLDCWGGRKLESKKEKELGIKGGRKLVSREGGRKHKMADVKKQEDFKIGRIKHV